MALQRAVGCDTPGCLALHLIEPGRDDAAVESSARAGGWDVPPDGLAVRCPACRHGRGPVIERGYCPVCSGPTYSGRHAEVCHSCGHAEPHLADDDEDQEDDADAAGDVDQDHARTPWADR